MAETPRGPAPYEVRWDNGAGACGTFPERFATEAEAQRFADDWVHEMTALLDDADYDGDGYSAEVALVGDDPDDE